jgi:hypothetical protein
MEQLFSSSIWQTMCMKSLYLIHVFLHI